MEKKQYGEFLVEVRPDTLDEYVCKEVLTQGCYIKKVKPITKNDVWLDAGANIGVFSLQIAPFVKKVYAFEPNAANALLARTNLIMNGITNVVLEETALVANSDKERILYLNTQKNKGSHSFHVKRGREVEKVQCTDINRVISDYGINKIKMDVEGAEIELIPAINFKNIDELIMEFHFAALKDKDSSIYRSIIKKLEKEFSIVEYNGSPKKAWTTLIHAVK